MGALGPPAGSAVVVVAGQPHGIITERDVLRAVAETADLATTKVRDQMTANVVTITPSWEVVDAARLMIEKRFRHLVVVNDSGALVGIVSIRDIVKALVESANELLRDRLRRTARRKGSQPDARDQCNSPAQCRSK
ncbi:MAG: CBS domain-containing protein [Acidobacteria bacterium]|nr:CBS domain-containing protein [Acidobacteriota bacterium]